MNEKETAEFREEVRKRREAQAAVDAALAADPWAGVRGSLPPPDPEQQQMIREDHRARMMALAEQSDAFAAQIRAADAQALGFEAVARWVEVALASGSGIDTPVEERRRGLALSLAVKLEPRQGMGVCLTMAEEVVKWLETGRIG